MDKQNRARVTVPYISSVKGGDRKISALTAYDYSTAKIIDSAGIDIILIGDSLASVIQGFQTTIPVTLDEVIYHCKCVTRGVEKALVVGDLPFLSYQISTEQAILSAGRLLKEGGVAAVKLEGGINVLPQVKGLVRADIPVMGHIGLTPQSYHRMGGHKIQGVQVGNGIGESQRLIDDAVALDEAGVFSIVLEGIPAELAAEITNKVSVPTIGIGAGPQCDGQILVINDLVGLSVGRTVKFAKRYVDLGSLMAEGVCRFIAETQNGEFPTPDNFKSCPK